MKADKTPEWDVIIVGGGPAGLSAAVLLARMKRNVLLFDSGNQRNIRSHGMHNFPTRDGMLPPDYLELTHQEALNYGVTLVNFQILAAERLSDYHFRVRAQDGKTYESRRILLATGVQDSIPDIPGMYELWGSAIHHCPYCDGWECRDHVIGLYASKNNGYGEALALRHLAEKVVLFTDRAYKLNTKQTIHLKARNIDIEYGKVVRLDFTDNDLHGVVLEDGRTIPVQKMFVNHGMHIHDALLNQLGCRTSKKGAAITNRKQQTSVPGVYVAGDAAIDVHFVVVAAAEGAKAGVAIHTDLLNIENLAAIAVKDPVS
jgi:thioredoxin reductase